MSKYSKFLNLIVVAALLLTSASTVLAGPSTPKKPVLSTLKQAVVELKDASRGIAAAPQKTRSIDPDALVQLEPEDVVDMNEPATYIVQFQDPALAMYKGGIGGMAPTHAGTRGERKLNTRSAASQAYLKHLDAQQTLALANMGKTLGRDLAVQYRYKYALNGAAIEMTPNEARIVAQLPEVRYIEREKEYELHTDAGPEWIGAGDLWDGTATDGAVTTGEGVIVGVIDTGIDPFNPSFADVGDDSYDHTNPNGAGNYVGVCNPADPSYDATFPCNDKLIGAWGFPTVNGGDPRDYDGHGSHTASTSAGNVVNGTLITVTDGTTFTADISGVAPHANIIAYAACCTGGALTAARDQAVADGVDVINYSIGSDSATPDPYNETESMQWLAMREAGIWVATSAGNNGPGDATLGSPGDLPWITTVGATSHDRTFLNTLVMTNGNALSPTIFIDGESMPGALIPPTRIVLSSWYTDGGAISDEDARLCRDNIFPPGTFDGEIVVCERGEYGRVAKGQTVLNGGAGGYILAQPDEFGGGPGALSTDPHVLPAVHINYYEYQDLLAAMSSGYITGTISGSSLAKDPMYADIMASFSSRGQNQAFPDLIAPSVSAPGRAIWAAYINGGGGEGDYTYNVIQGTSMSSPHVAGSFALLKELHPEWSPAEAQSALMLTSVNVVDDDGMTPATPFDQGSGRVNLSNAARIGFVLDITQDEYTASNPALGGDPKDLNLASLGDSQCLGSCTWTRTLSSVLPYSVTWTASYASADGVTMTVAPAVFELGPGATQAIEITADVSAFPVTETWKFAEVILTPDVVGVPDAHFPVAAQPTSGVIPSVAETSMRRDAGSMLIEGLQTIAAPDLTIESFGLFAPTTYAFTLTRVISTTGMGFPAIFFQEGPGIEFTEVTVPAGSARLVASIQATTSPDLDMIVFLDSDDDGVPELTDVNPAAFCQSAAGGSDEFCHVLYPVPGRWFVAVLNYEESATPPDDVLLGVTLVGAGNLTATGPDSVLANEPYDVRVFWNEPAMEAGETWYGLIALGSDADHPGNIGAIPLNIHREADDVVKTVEPAAAEEGDVVTFTITVEPNVTNEDLAYMITDTLPAGLSYVPGSLQASSGVAAESNGVITWTGSPASFPVPIPRYLVSTSDTDPLCDTGFGGYVDLAGFGIPPQSGITGDTGTWTALSGQNPFQFYGIDNTGVSFTDDGFAFFDSTAGDEPWTNTDLPDPDDPNDMLAMLWADGEIVYDGTPGQYAGVSIATANTEISVIEYDDLYNYPAEDDSIMGDVEVVFYSTIDNSPGAYEMIVAYDNIQDLPDSVTVGTENVNGSEATRFLYGNPTGVITDGLMVCFDYTVYTPANPDPVVITYQAEVETGAVTLETITNTVYHNTDNPGSMEAGADAALTVTGYTLTVDVVGEGSVTRTPDQVRYASGTQVMLEAIPAEGWIFDNWNGSSLLLNPMTVTIDSDLVVTATFVALPTYTLSVDVVGQGSVVKSPLDDSYYQGQVVTLTAIPAQTWEFAHWGGDVTGTTNPVVVTVLSDMAVTATFTAIPTYTLDVGVVGSGSVTVNPEADYYLEGASVQLTAVPAAGWNFAGWSGGAGGADNPTTVVMDANKVVTATFTEEPVVTFALTVNVSGGGSVTKVPSATTYISGTPVQLTAVPAAGWQFDGWSGDLTGTTNPASITMNEDKTVVATFTAMADTYTLDVATVGSGSVDADPDMAEYVDGTVVTLTAVPETGWRFTGWSGALTGMANPTTITMDADKAVTATFTAIPTYTLDVNVVGNGAVTQAPDAEFYFEGASVQLTANPDANWYFAGWSGDAGGADNPTTVVMDGNKVVTVTFTTEPVVTYTLTVNVTGSGSVTKVPSATTYISGTSVTLTGVPAAGWEFSAWSGDVVTMTNPIAVVMDADKTVTATFVESGVTFRVYLPLVARQAED